MSAAIELLENQIELLEEDIEVFHLAMDGLGVPRANSEGFEYSMFGRAKYLSKHTRENDND